VETKDDAAPRQCLRREHIVAPSRRGFAKAAAHAPRREKCDGLSAIFSR
jgi:hypothetical protein